MSNHTHHTGLVTGASSGLGFEASAQLAEAGYGRVVVTARTADKGQKPRLAWRSEPGETCSRHWSSTTTEWSRWRLPLQILPVVEAGSMC